MGNRITMLADEPESCPSVHALLDADEGRDAHDIRQADADEASAGLCDSEWPHEDSVSVLHSTPPLECAEAQHIDLSRQEQTDGQPAGIV
jgi:hypothetical protein